MARRIYNPFHRGRIPLKVRLPNWKELEAIADELRESLLSPEDRRERDEKRNAAKKKLQKYRRIRKDMNLNMGHF
jgi:hypothetical protein